MQPFRAHDKWDWNQPRRVGNLYSADGWEDMLLPEIDRQQKAGKEVVFRADAAFAKPEVYEALEARDEKGKNYS